MSFICPWLELAIAITLIGPPFLSRLRHPDHVYRWSVVLIGATFGCTALAWLAFYVEVPATIAHSAERATGPFRPSTLRA